jgi:hypothetical protein
LIHKKLADITFIIISIVLLLVQISLAQYFLTTLVPLGSDLWGYSVADIKQTVGAAGGLPTLLIIAIVVFSNHRNCYCFVWLPKKLKMNELAQFSYSVFILGAIFTYTYIYINYQIDAWPGICQ